MNKGCLQRGSALVVCLVSVSVGLASPAWAQAPPVEGTLPKQPQDTQDQAVDPPLRVPEPAEPPDPPVPPSPPPPEPAPAPPPPRAAEGAPAPADFARKPYAVTLGEGDSQWKMSFYGFVEFDAMRDSTRSYGDFAGPLVLERDETLGGQRGRTQFSARNSRLGFRMESPRFAGIKASAMFEVDGFDDQGQVPEGAFFSNPSIRLRHANFRLETDYVDVLAGLSYALFGQQPYFFPCSVQILALPNMVFNRSDQLRLSHTFKTSAIDVDVAVAAIRPPERDAPAPEGEGALRIKVNGWKGMHTLGSGGTAADPLTIGVSGLVRSFEVNEFAAVPQRFHSARGWGVSIDALIPVIPVSNADHRGNALTLNGSFVVGTGIADRLGGMSAGMMFPPLPNPTGATPAPTYPANIDNGLVGFDAAGDVRTVNWRTFLAGVQYYLPPSGRVFVAANYTQGESNNMADLNDARINPRVYKRSRYVDGNVFFDITPAVRVGFSYQLTMQTFIDDATARNHRWMMAGYYFF